MPENIINHVAIVADESSSMNQHRATLPKVLDTQTEALADFSKQLDQETRATIYTFNSRGTTKCVHFDKDVLRLPSMSGHYRPRGMTSLVDSTLKAIEDLEKTATMYGDHSFLIYVLTDGMNNDNYHQVHELRDKINSLPGNWTLACLVPDKMGLMHAQQYGFPQDNIQVWDATTTAGVKSMGDVIRSTTETYMRSRAQGIKGTKNLFSLKPITGSDIVYNLHPLAALKYTIFPVTQDDRIDDTVARLTGHGYQVGKTYYQLTKTEIIQPQKSIAILYQGNVYVGEAARRMLGLPNEHVKVRPADYTNYTIFVQSTSLNRKLLHGTNVLVLK